MLEPTERYEPGGYHKVQTGEVYNEHYQIIRQLGWGRFSTVWLVQDTREGAPGAMKILVGDFESEKGDWDELGALKTLPEANTQSSGYHHICQLVDDFVHHGPNGTHTRLILEPMGPSVLDIYRAFSGPMPLPSVRRISKHDPCALQYLHECDLIHTDIKGDNILMSGPPAGIGQENIRLDYEQLTSNSFKLADFGATNKMSNRFAQMIQPVALRSPLGHKNGYMEPWLSHM
ncbi:kinase-like protein [Pluteus cervinus]|uniref:Kinase-like protein n=1 Tax=Pluteus cervinus TaxID=181527 RepID=A0ACD2ZX32_9AGAR|nr:kinase-like protein [Pluteus cervinus]